MTVYTVTGAALVGLGAVALILKAHPLRRLLAANVTGTGVFMILVGLSAARGGPVPDPVAHALVLTGIVVAVAATGLGVGLAVALSRARASEPGRGGGRT